MARAFSLAVNSIETCCSVFDVDRGISGIPFAGDTGHETKEAQEGSFKSGSRSPKVSGKRDYCTGAFPFLPLNRPMVETYRNVIEIILLMRRQARNQTVFDLPTVAKISSDKVM
jgi:hypothetical protein